MGTREDKEKARQTLALLTAAGGTYQETLKALEILGVSDQNTNKGNQTQSSGILRTQAQLLALRPNQAQRRQAIAIFEELIKRGTNQPDDLFRLATLYEADRRWPETRKVMETLLKKYANNPNYLVYYVGALLRYEAIEDAQTWLAALEKVAPNQPITIGLQARLLAKKGLKAEATQKLQDFAKGDPNRLEQVAGLLEQLGQLTEAEAMYRAIPKAFPQVPTNILPLVGFLGRQARTKEALALLDDQAWKSMSADVASDACVNVLYNADAKDPGLFDELCNQAAARIEKAFKEMPDKIALQFALANIRSIQGQVEQAERIYRDVAVKNRSTGMALNNLAWLLALEGGKKAEEAADIIQQAIGIDGETPDLLDTRGVVRLTLERPEEAIQDLEEAIAVKPSADKEFHLARAYLVARRREEARERFKKAIELGLTRSRLHPLERSYYDRLKAELPSQ